MVDGIFSDLDIHPRDLRPSKGAQTVDTRIRVDIFGVGNVWDYIESCIDLRDSSRKSYYFMYSFIKKNIILKYFYKKP